jgi:hypothetical protein
VVTTLTRIGPDIYSTSLRPGMTHSHWPFQNDPSGDGLDNFAVIPDIPDVGNRRRDFRLACRSPPVNGIAAVPSRNYSP